MALTVTLPLAMRLASLDAQVIRTIVGRDQFTSSYIATVVGKYVQRGRNGSS